MEEDFKKIRACAYFKDYFSVAEYIELVINKYTGEEKNLFLEIRKNVRCGDYKKVRKLLKL